MEANNCDQHFCIRERHMPTVVRETEVVNRASGQVAGTEILSNITVRFEYGAREYDGFI